MRILPLIGLLLASPFVWAQTPGPVSAQSAPGGAALIQPQGPSEGRRNQKIERIHLEDSGSRIDEVRYGGQTQSITVQPKADVPEYGIAPPDLARSRPGDHRDGMSNATGQRFWNVLKF